MQSQPQKVSLIQILYAVLQAYLAFRKEKDTAARNAYARSLLATIKLFVEDRNAAVALADQIHADVINDNQLGRV
ncbi:MAG: hypothetical protein AAF720_00945 [Pseudomonadota bacterium]